MRPPLILDSGAVIGEAGGSSRVRALLGAAFEQERRVLVPAGVVAQTIRGGAKDALINRLLKRPDVEVTVHDERRARIAGALLAASSNGDAIDALVVAEALDRGGALIATSDPRDLRMLSTGHPEVDIVTV